MIQLATYVLTLTADDDLIDDASEAETLAILFALPSLQRILELYMFEVNHARQTWAPGFGIREGLTLAITDGVGRSERKEI